MKQCPFCDVIWSVEYYGKFCPLPDQPRHAMHVTTTLWTEHYVDTIINRFSLSATPSGESSATLTIGLRGAHHED